MLAAKYVVYGRQHSPITQAYEEDVCFIISLLFIAGCNLGEVVCFIV
jgi:hypothetical protein